MMPGRHAVTIGRGASVIETDEYGVPFDGAEAFERGYEWTAVPDFKEAEDGLRWLRQWERAAARQMEGTEQ